MKFLSALSLVITMAVTYGSAGPRSEVKPSGSARRPAILFTNINSGFGMEAQTLDAGFVKQLREAGFEVDYVRDVKDLTWEDVRRFNVLVTGPKNLLEQDPKRGAEQDAKLEEFVFRFLEAKGGVFLYVPDNHFWTDPCLLPVFSEKLGLRIPAERMVEENPENVRPMTHIPGGQTLAYTDAILPSPVSEGVHGIWYPNREVYLAQQTNPLWVSPEWTPVVRATQTTVNKRVDFANAPNPLNDPFYFAEEGTRAPVLFAVRDYGAGRLAAVSQWPQFSFVSGSHWLFQSQVLSKGLDGRPSDYGRLLINTFRWLAEPSMQGVGLGGHVTDEQRLLPPNWREGAQKAFEENFWRREPALGHGRPVQGGRTMRGLIGARTTHGGGSSTVQEYAAAAKELGLDFVVILDDFAKLTPEKLEALKADCEKYSDEKVRLFAGYSMATDGGNRAFLFGPTIFWPEDSCLAGPDNSLLRLQGAPGQPSHVSDWLLRVGRENNVGFSDFKNAAMTHGMRLRDCRDFSLAPIRHYRNGELLEDNTEEYRVTAQGAIPPGPMVLNEVDSVEGMRREVQQGHALTHARAGSLDTLFKDALRWSHQYDALNIFPSDGPEILAWPQCVRVFAFGGDNFLTGQILMPAHLSVRSDVGLKEIRIYNGASLYRRILLNGEKAFETTLILEAAIQKNLVLEVEDIRGGRAVSYARRSWKESGWAVVYCSDHVNDCKSPADGPMLMAHGPYQLPLLATPQVPDAGQTWDGGPPAMRALLEAAGTMPSVQSDLGIEEGGRFRQTPLLEFTDEGAVAITSPRDEYYPEETVPFANPWHGFGPTRPSKLFDYQAWFRAWLNPALNVDPVRNGSVRITDGIQPTLFRSRLRFKQDQALKQITLAAFAKGFPDPEAFLVIGRGGGKIETVPLAELKGPQEFRIGTGDWFALSSPGDVNASAFINRGEPVVFRVAPPETVGGWAWLLADAQGRTVAADEKLTYEYAALNFPTTASPHTPEETARLMAYFMAPRGLTVRRGALDTTSPGLLDVTATDGAIEIAATDPGDMPHLVLPGRIHGLNPRWSAGLWQRKGYGGKFYHQDGKDLFTPLGMDLEGVAHFPLASTWAKETEILAGHPVIADAAGREAFIQVTHISENPHQWHVSINNPTDKPLTTTLQVAMDLPGLEVPKEPLTLAPGEYRVLAGGETQRENAAP